MTPNRTLFLEGEGKVETSTTVWGDKCPDPYPAPNHDAAKTRLVFRCRQ